MTRYSLTEIETHCRKAARGAGYHWGEAEELSKAARWLCAKGQDGATETLTLLQQVDGICDKRRPVSIDKGSLDHPVCGLTLGCALADRGFESLDGFELRGTIIQPLLMVGVLGISCADTTLEITTDNGVAVMGRDVLVLDGKWDSAGIVSITKLASAPNLYPTQFTDVDPEIWAALGAFAHRTYVPATEESRARGAG